ncbi:WDR33, partial [Cervus elaphus hippelaphus]
NRIWQRDQRDMRAIQPDAGYYNDLVPPIGMLNNPMNAVTTKFVRTSTNKVKCPVFVVRNENIAMATEIGSPPRFFHMPRFQHQAPRQLFYKRPDFAQQQAMQQLTFDGKRMRKAVNRKTIDYNPSVIKYLE